MLPETITKLETAKLETIKPETAKLEAKKEIRKNLIRYLARYSKMVTSGSNGAILKID